MESIKISVLTFEFISAQDQLNCLESAGSYPEFQISLYHSNLGLHSEVVLSIHKRKKFQCCVSASEFDFFFKLIVEF